MLAKAEFNDAVHDALVHLYDVHGLQTNSLCELLGLASNPEAALILRRKLIAAVKALEPDKSVPVDSESWRIYEILLCRYVQQCTQDEVAFQLGLSVRHLRRLEKEAVLAFCDHFAVQVGLDLAQMDPSGRDIHNSSEVSELRGELANLRTLHAEAHANWDQILPAILELARPLATKHAVRLESCTAEGLPSLAVHTMVLRQVVLSLLAIAIRRSSGGSVSIEAVSKEDHVEIHIRGSGFLPLMEQDDSSLKVVYRLVNTFGGDLTIHMQEPAFAACLTIPRFEPITVLVIDDNADAIAVMQRYASDSRYRIVGTSDPAQVMSQISDVCPKIIVLDVMMPALDGWELLGRLRQHPLTRDIPVVVCTILAEEELALSLGADAFVSKPISREAFLRILDQQVEALDSGQR